MLLARPYPVQRLAEARSAIALAAGRPPDLRPLLELYKVARSALADLDPDEVADFRRDHPRAAATDAAAIRAAHDVSDTWEGVVSVGAGITDVRRFRGFAWLAAHLRYVPGGLGERQRLEHFEKYVAGFNLPETSAEDAALFAAVPALIGLGPELPDEIAEPCPVPGTPVWELLGLPAEGEYAGIDPLDGIAVPPETLQAHYAGLPAAWRDLATRCLDRGMIVRTADKVD